MFRLSDYLLLVAASRLETRSESLRTGITMLPWYDTHRTRPGSTGIGRFAHSAHQGGQQWKRAN